MPIVIRTGTVSKTVSASSFKDEKELEVLLSNHPELLHAEDGQKIAFVCGQVILRDAGRLDLLFATNEGLPNCC